MQTKLGPLMGRRGDFPQRAKGETPGPIPEHRRRHLAGSLQRQAVLGKADHTEQLLAARLCREAAIPGFHQARPVPSGANSIDESNQPVEVAGFDKVDQLGGIHSYQLTSGLSQRGVYLCDLTRAGH